MIYFFILIFISISIAADDDDDDCERLIHGIDDLDERPVAPDDDSVDLPVIDLQADNAVELIAAAAEEWGFFQLVNHGISEQLIEQVWEKTRSFFKLEQEQKEQILRIKEVPWGYGRNELTKNKRDRKETFDYTTPGVDPIYHGENHWPSFDHEFQSVLEQYLDECAKLSLRLLEKMCEGLGFEPERLNPLFDQVHTGFIRLNFYPVKDPMAGLEGIPHLKEANLGVHHHADAGALTVLLQDEVGGLQVFHGGFWYNVKPLPGAFVINTGDAMQVWSNDKYQAAVHRVVKMTHSERYSLPFFYNPSVDAIIKPLTENEDEALYNEFSWKKFRSARTDGDYADFGEEIQIAQFKK